MGFVRGGTTTSAYDAQLARQRADTEQRRRASDAQKQLARSHPDQSILRTRQLGGQATHASIVLAIRHPKDTTILEWMVCELSQQGEGGELALIMACPRCILTLHRPTGESQITVLQSNRKFYFTPAPPKWNQARGHIWVNPKDPNEVVTIAGTVDLPEWCTCPHLGCGWKFQIEDSVVRTK